MLKYVSAGPRCYGERPVYPYRRPNHEFQLIASGTASPWMEGAVTESDSPRLWLFGRGHLHGWRDSRPLPCRMAVFHFTALHPLFEDALSEMPLLSVRISPEAAAGLMRMAEKARALLGKPGPASTLAIERMMLELSMLLLPALPPRLNAGEDARAEQLVEEVCTLCREQPAPIRSVDEFASAAGVSPAHLRRVFQKVKGKSPKAVFTEIRMQYARRRLQDGQSSIADLSGHLGFSEPGAFSRAYKNHFGHPPRAARAPERPDPLRHTRQRGGNRI